MGRVAWLILLVVVSVCIVFCVLCCLQNNPVFLSVTILSHISKMKIMSYVFWQVSSLQPEKKVLFLCLAGARSLLRPEKIVLVICLAGALEKKVLVICLAGARSLLQPKKKSSSHLSGGCAIIITTGKKKF